MLSLIWFTGRLEISNTTQLGAPPHKGITVKSAKELALMREAGWVVYTVKTSLVEAICPGITTAELDSVAEEGIRRLGAIPSFKGLYGFPATICTSINDEIVHGIPSGRVVREGDILSLDIGAVVGGFHSDTAFTTGVGQITGEAQRLIDATR